MTTRRDQHDRTLLEAARQACLEAAAAAYEEAGIRGLCGDGRWEYAMGVMRTLDLGAAIAAASARARESSTLQIKRVYEPPAPGDGARILVDRLWPRGLRREAASVDAWMPEVAPSAGLRKWFGHTPSRWAGFERRFAGELDAKPEAVRALVARLRAGQATLLFAARDVAHNNAVALRAYLHRRFDL